MTRERDQGANWKVTEGQTGRRTEGGVIRERDQGANWRQPWGRTKERDQGTHWITKFSTSGSKLKTRQEHSARDIYDKTKL